MKEFILNYYLYIKKSNSLRQYIIIYLDVIISVLKEYPEEDLIKNMKNFNFSTYKNREEIEFLKNDLKNREAVLMSLNVKNFKKFAPPSEKVRDLLSSSERKTLRMEILNKLRHDNPLLEEDF